MTRRIVSLLPSTTEILFAIGAGDQVVGVTFECDYPDEARSRRIVSTSALPPGLDAEEIDRVVTDRVRAGEDLYRLDSGALAELEPDLVVTQDLCAVCAVDVSVVDDALAYLGCTADVLTVDPHTLDEVLASVEALGSVSGREPAAAELVTGARHRLAAVMAAVAGLRRRRVLLLEWTEPPFAPGHWIPEMIVAAGGDPVLGTAGEQSRRVTWPEIDAIAPELVVVAPCGYHLDGATELAEELVAAGRFGDGVPVWAVDANASFARPGPRLIDGIEALAGIFHPDARGGPDPLMARRLA